MKMIFMGTPEFAAEALRALLGAGHEVTAVVTQPDKPKGRSGRPAPPPVKICALEAGIPVMQPTRIKTPEAVAELKKYEAEVYIVAAFGQMLSQEILDIPRFGCLNIHASLLPKYRGASPIQHAIIDGEAETGITIMRLDAGMDTGDMLYQKRIPIGAEDNYETLQNKLMKLGGETVTEALELLEQGKLTPVKQEDALSSHAPLIKKELGRLDFAKSAVELDRLIRGVTPWPGAFTGFRGKQLKIWRAAPEPGEDTSGHMPGEILRVERDALAVAADKGVLRILELQLEGKKRMSARDFIQGARPQAGKDFLGW